MSDLHNIERAITAMPVKDQLVLLQRMQANLLGAADDEVTPVNPEIVVEMNLRLDSYKLGTAGAQPMDEALSELRRRLSDARQNRPS
jgi:hypothetical protein